MKYSKQTLANGLTLIRVPMESVKSITALALVKVGSRYENAQNSGISHFLEHMVFKGTDQFATAQDVAIAIDSLGAEANAFTSKEYTGYYIKSASRHLDRAVDILSDMLLTPRLPEEDLEREKGVIIEEINMYEDNPKWHIDSVFDQMMFADTPLGRDVIGTRDTVRNMTRQDFLDHLQTWYGLANTVLILVGDADVLEKKTLPNQISKVFDKGDISDRATSTVHKFPGNLLSEETSRLVYRKTEQAHFILGFPSFNRTDPDRYALSLLSSILGGNMSSRLFNEVREKRGLCYYVHSYTDYYHDHGTFGAAAGVDPKRVEEAIEVTLAEFHKIKNQKHRVTAEELQRAKDFLIGHVILGHEDNQSVAQSYGLKYLLEGSILTVEDVVAKISGVNLDQVNRITKRIIEEDQVRFAMIGPFKDESKFAKIVKK